MSSVSSQPRQKSQVDNLIEKARHQELASLGELLELYRNYLAILATH